MLDRYNRERWKYRLKKGYDSLIQNVILKELINIMGTTIKDLDMEKKWKIVELIILKVVCFNFVFYKWK